MSSGHFLVEAVDFITDRLLAFLNQFPINPVTFMLDRTRKNILDALGEQNIAVDPDKLTEVNLLKRHVLKRCIYGVDLNPMAVELAKVCLWLDAFTIGAPLSFLDHHLRCGNSLIGASFTDLQEALAPATGSASGVKFQKSMFSVDYEPLLRAIHHVLFVNKMADATAAEVKKSASEYGEARNELSGYQVVLDLLVARHFGVPEGMDLLARGGQDLDLSSRKRFRQSLENLNERGIIERAEAVAKESHLRFFHWEIEFPGVFFGFADADVRRVQHKNEIRERSAGFDAVVGNPPYDVLAEKELGTDLSSLKAFITSQKDYVPAVVGKQNLYKLFICRDFSVLRHKGHLGHIVPMALLGDEQSCGVRKLLNTAGTLQLAEAFPQKDDPKRRIFEDAKLSTCVFVVAKSADESRFRVRVHPGKDIIDSSPSLLMSRADPALYDPENQPIVACSQEDWDLATRVMASGRMVRLGHFCEASQGEVNETSDVTKGFISESPNDGPQVLRGSNICLYVLRPPSQGEAIYLRKNRYLNGKKRNTKAWHHQYNRVGVQESCPQNNFRRVIASFIPVDEFCNHKINYFPEPGSKYPLGFLLSILNSRLADWYFRLGSTNASVSHYQLYNLPAPQFTPEEPSIDSVATFIRCIDQGNIDGAFQSIEDLLADSPFPSTVRECILSTVIRIIDIERGRGDIVRAERSALAESAQLLQDLLDKIFYRMAGLTDEEAAGLEERLSHML